MTLSKAKSFDTRCGIISFPPLWIDLNKTVGLGLLAPRLAYWTRNHTRGHNVLQKLYISPYMINSKDLA